MSDEDLLAEEFEAHRDRLRAVAYRVLGSANEADDAVQEAWLRLQRSDGIDNLGGWLTTVVSRVCLDMLRSRSSRREDAFTDVADEPATLRAIPVIPSSRPSSRTPWAAPCSSYSSRWRPPSGWRSSCTTCSRCRSRRSRRSSGAPRLPPVSWPAVPAGGCSDPTRCPSPVTARWSMPSWPHPGVVTSPACWRCSTRTPWSWPTRQPCGWDPTHSSPGAQSVAETFAGRARAARPALIDGAPGAAWLHKGDLVGRLRVHDRGGPDHRDRAARRPRHAHRGAGAAGLTDRRPVADPAYAVSRARAWCRGR